MVMDEANSGTLSAVTRPTRIRLGRRIWLDDLGVPVFGTGIRELLIRVQSTGSLRRAASDMGMAYSKAWHIVRRAEDHLGFKLLERQTGGRRGGGSIVSGEGKWLVGAFGALVDEAGALLDELYAKHFGESLRAGNDIRIEEPRGESGLRGGK
jgi:molybdate transport system regulatory protein